MRLLAIRADGARFMSPDNIDPGNSMQLDGPGWGELSPEWRQAHVQDRTGTGIDYIQAIPQAYTHNHARTVCVPTHTQRELLEARADLENFNLFSH